MSGVVYEILVLRQTRNMGSEDVEEEIICSTKTNDAGLAAETLRATANAIKPVASRPPNLRGPLRGPNDTRAQIAPAPDESLAEGVARIFRTGP